MAPEPTKYKGRYRVESSRLKGWDYSLAGYYFITICTKERIPYFGEIVNGEMHRSALGEIAQQYWDEIPDHFPQAALDEFVVMPNHVHGIIIINVVETQDDILVETQHAASLRESRVVRGLPKPGSISVIVRSYKSGVRRWAGLNDHNDFAWQARFYDHIIRDEKSLENIRAYICVNPAKWETDEYCA